MHSIGDLESLIYGNRYVSSFKIHCYATLSPSLKDWCYDWKIAFTDLVIGVHATY